MASNHCSIFHFFDINETEYIFMLTAICNTFVNRLSLCTFTI